MQWLSTVWRSGWVTSHIPFRTIITQPTRQNIQDKREKWGNIRYEQIRLDQIHLSMFAKSNVQKTMWFRNEFRLWITRVKTSNDHVKLTWRVDFEKSISCDRFHGRSQFHESSQPLEMSLNNHDPITKCLIKMPLCSEHQKWTVVHWFLFHSSNYLGKWLACDTEK